MPYGKTIAALGVLLLTGCASLFYNPDRPIERHFQNYGITPPESPSSFFTCNHYGCAGQAEISLSAEHWRRVAQLFSPPAEDAAAERKQIAAAIGLLEQLTGPQSNTFADQACNNFREPIESFQLDCVAEATNATIYLQLLQQAQLLRWHQVSHPAQRELFVLFIPHFSAVIRQTDTGALFAVDSWFFANGEQAVVVPLELWRKNYYPRPCRNAAPPTRPQTTVNSS